MPNAPPRPPTLRQFALVVAIAYFLVAAAVTARVTDLLRMLFADLAGLALLTIGMAAVAILVFGLGRYPQRRNDHPLIGAYRFLRDRATTDRMTAACIPLIAAALTLSAYNVFKQFVLPDVGFWFGKSVAAADRAILGRDAWQITHALLPYAWETKLLDVIYHSWFAPMSLGIVACCFARSGSRSAERYIASYVLVWIVQGSILAYCLPAAGPCFAGALRHVKRFAPLMARLHAQQAYLVADGAGGLTALDYQATLLERFGTGGEAMLGAGISAMPSLHNALATLFACAGFQIDRRLGIALSVYTVMIWVGSVHLGWHYALDGVVGAGVSILIWHACGWLQRRLTLLPNLAPKWSPA